MSRATSAEGEAESPIVDSIIIDQSRLPKQSSALDSFLDSSTPPKVVRVEVEQPGAQTEEETSSETDSVEESERPESPAGLVESIETDAEEPEPEEEDGNAERENVVNPTATSDEEDNDSFASPSESGSSSDDEDEEEEPTLKYTRMEASVPTVLSTDSASSLVLCPKFLIIGTHNGNINVFDYAGGLFKEIKRCHSAMINDLSVDDESAFVAAASMDGRISIHSLTTPDPPILFDLKRPMRCVALEPAYSKKSTRQFVSGGMAGNLILHEKGWLGNKELILHSGEGPIWAVKWMGSFIAWGNDAGVRIYDTSTAQRITYISRSADSPRADLFKLTLHWSNPTTLLIGWADYIKIAKIKEREPRRGGVVGGLTTSLSGTKEVYVEIEKIFQVDCMISGIVDYGKKDYLILAYPTEEEEEEGEEVDPYKRKDGFRPELRIISSEGKELSSDALSLKGFEKFSCRDYSLSLAPPPAPSPSTAPSTGKKSKPIYAPTFYITSPKEIIVSKPRDEEDHINWLIEQKQYKNALDALEKSLDGKLVERFDSTEIGKKYLQALVEDGQYSKAADNCKRILAYNAKLWEDWIFLFVEKGQMEVIIPFIPTHDPQLSRLVYEMVLAHFLRHDLPALRRTIGEWSTDIYDVAVVIIAIKDQLERKPNESILMECLAELYIKNRQPGKALPYFLTLRKPDVFNLIREHNLFNEVQDQVLSLIEFDVAVAAESAEKESKEGRHAKEATDSSWVAVGTEEGEKSKSGSAIDLLVDHTHSIPFPRVIAQLQSNRLYLFRYLDALFDKDPHLAFDYSDLQVELYASFEPNKLMDFLRASNYYSLEAAYKICDKLDLVPEMVFLLGRMGDNKRALNLIIERLGDVQRAIEFARDQNDLDLWEDLLKYSETKPTFIRGLLENVGAEIDPVQLIRRIKNGLEIPGLKFALIKILQDYNLQISLMEGCKTILYSDCRQLALTLHEGQAAGFLWTGDTTCQASHEPIYPHLNGGSIPTTLPIGIHFLCNHSFNALDTFSDVPATSSTALLAAELLDQGGNDIVSSKARAMSSKLRLAMDVRSKGLKGNAGCAECFKAVSLH